PAPPCRRGAAAAGGGPVLARIDVQGAELYLDAVPAEPASDRALPPFETAPGVTEPLERAALEGEAGAVLADLVALSGAVRLPARHRLARRRRGPRRHALRERRLARRAEPHGRLRPERARA